MAKIPMGNFGQAMPDVQRINLPQNQSGQIIGGALQNFSQVTNQFAEQIDKQQREAEVSAKRLELYNNDLDKREGQLKVDEVIATEFSDKVVDLKNQVGNGALTSDKANADLKVWSDARFAQIRPELPHHAQKDYQDYWNATVNKQSGAFLPLQIKASEQKEIVLTNRAFDVATRLSRDEGREYLNKQLDQANISESRKQELKLNYESTRDKLELDSAIEQAFAAGDAEALRTAQASIKEKINIDGPTAQHYSASISSKLTTLQQRAEVLERKRINEAGKVFNQFKTDVLTGRNQDESYIADVKTAVAGTEHEAEFNFYLSQSKNFSTFSNLSTSEQLARINKSKAAMKSSSTANAENERKVLAVYEKIYQEKLKTLKENPTQALSESGIKVPELSSAELKVNSSKVAKDIVKIGSYQVAMKDKDGNLAIKPISAETLPGMKQAFDAMTVNQKLDFIGQLIGETKGMKGGQGIWSEALKQLGNEDRTYYLAGLARAKNKKIGNEDLSTTLINGKHLVDNGKYILPTELETRFRDKYGNLISQGSFADDFKSFKLAYAAIGSRNGITHSDKKDLADAETIRKAFELTTGGIYEQGVSGWFGSFKTTEGGRFKTWKVPKPYGMTDERFKAHLTKGYSALSKAYGYSVEGLKDYRLVPRIDQTNNLIMYSLMNEQGKVLKNPKNGQEQFMIFEGLTR